MPNVLDNLYRNLSEDGYQLGSQEDFRKAMADSTKAANLYKNLSDDGYQLGSQEEFFKNVGNNSMKPTGSHTKPVKNRAQSQGTQVKSQGAQVKIPQGFGELDIDKAKFGAYGTTNPAAVGEAKRRREEAYGKDVVQRRRTEQTMKAVKGDREAAQEVGLDKVGQQLRDRMDYTMATGKDLKHPLAEKGFDLTRFGIAPTVGRDEQGNILYGEDGKPLVGSVNDEVRANTQRVVQERNDLWKETYEQAQEKLASLKEQMKANGEDMTLSKEEHIAKRNTLKAAYDEQQRLIEALEDEARGGHHGFLDGLWDAAKDADTWLLGTNKFDGIRTKLRVSEKVKSGEALTTEEQGLLDATIENNAVRQRIDDDSDWLYRAGRMTTEMVPFMGQILFTGGYGGVAAVGERMGQKWATKYAQKFGEKALLNRINMNVIRGLGIGMGDVAAGFVSANTTGAVNTLNDAMERRIGKLGYDEQGNYQFTDDEDWLRAIMKAEVSQTKEFATERFGEHLVGLRRLNVMLAKQGPTARNIARALSGFAGTKAVRKTSQWLRKGGVNGVVGEVLEEEIGLPVDVAIGDMTWEQALSKKTQGDIVGGMLLSLGSMHAVGLTAQGAGKVAYTAQYYRYKNRADKADKIASFRMTADKWQPLKEQIDGTTAEDMNDLWLRIVDDGGLSVQEKRAAYDYINALTLMRGYNMGMLFSAREAARDNRLKPEQMTAEEAEELAVMNAEDEGRSAVLADEKKQMVDDWVSSGAGSEEPEDLESRLKAARAQGVFEGALDDIELRVEQENAKVRENSYYGVEVNYISGGLNRNDADGRVIQVGIGDRTYYIVGGDIQLSGDQDMAGTGIDVNASGEAIVVRDAETGEIDVKSPQQMTLLSVTPTQQMIDYNENVLRQQLTEQADNDITFGSPKNEVFAQNDEVTLNDGNGGTVTGVIEQTTPEGAFLVEISGSVAPFTADELNRRIVAHNGQSLQAPPEEVPSDLSQNGNDGMNGENGNDGLTEIDDAMPMVGDGIDAEPDFSRATPDRAHRYIFDEAGLTREEGRQFVEANQKSAEKELERLRKKAPTIGTSIAKYRKEQADWQSKVDAAQQQVDYWNSVAAQEANIVNQEAEREFEERQQDASGRQSLLDEQRDLQTKIQTAKRVYGDYFDEDFTVPHDVMELVAMNMPRNISWEGREGVRGLQQELGLRRGIGRNADSNAFNAYLAKKGEGIGVERAVHNIWESAMNELPNGEKLFEDSEIRNALIDMFMSAEKPSDIRDYVLNARIAEAESMRASEDEAQRNALAEWAEAYHLEPEEMEAFEAYMQEPPTAIEEEYYNTIYYNQLAEDYEREQNFGSKGLDRELEQGATGTGTPTGEGEVRELAAGEKEGEVNHAGRGSAEAEVGGRGEAVSDDNVVGGASEGPQPIGRGDFGEIYDQFRGKPKEAIDFLTKKKSGEALGALSHKDIGEIDLVWGEEGTGSSDGYGLAKLVKYHPEVLENLQEILDGMEIVKRTENRINLESTQYKAAVRLTWNEQSKTWLLTVFEKKNSALDNTTDTGKTSDRGKRNDTATPQSTVSEGKGTEKVSIEQENLGKSSSTEEIAAQEAQVDTNPTEAQKEAGNYQKGHIKVDGYDITIENPKGSVRRGTDASGQPWEVTMNNTYGYIRGTEGVDGDHIDVFLSDDPTSGNVFVVDQVNPDGSFDEHKVMYGFASEEEARAAYLANYSPGWQGLGGITEVSREEFKKWVESSHRKTKPFAEYKGVKKERLVSEEGTANIEERGARSEEDAGVLPLAGNGHLLEKEAEKSGDDTHVGYSRTLQSSDGTLQRSVFYDGKMIGSHWLPGERLGGAHGAIRAAFGEMPEENYDLLVPQFPGENDAWEIDGRDVIDLDHGDVVRFHNEKDMADFYLRNRQEIDRRIDRQQNADASRMQKAGEKEVQSVGKEEAALRDALIGMLRGAGIEVSTDWEEGERVLDADRERRAKLMGSRVEKRKARIASELKGRELTAEQQLVVDVFTGVKDNQPLEVTDKSGKTRRVVMRQGNERGAGTKHSIFGHYGTTSNGYKADELLLIPDIIRNGDRNQKGGRVAYEIIRDGITYTVTTEQSKSGLERFTNFYTNRKPTAVLNGTSNTDEQHVPQQSDSGAKLQKVSEKDKQDTEKIFDAAKKKFGVTNDIREAGYILPDGTMLDFSGRHELDAGTDSSFLKGQRSTDHREISKVAYDRDADGNEVETGIETSMPDFIERGAIRIDASAGTINLSQQPTQAQREVLRRLVVRNDGAVSVDFGNGWDSDHYAEYDEARPQRVLSDIDKYFDEGIKPAGDYAEGVSYQKVSPVFYSNALRAVEGIKQEKATPEQWLKMIEKQGGLKVGEDKWLGLSEWLKGNNAKTLTKQEVLDFINENKIQIEEVHYADIDADKLFVEEEDAYRLKGDENTYINKNGAAYVDGKYIGSYNIDDGKARIAREKGVGERPLNDTRLQYTTKGLENKREIALTSPTIESWNESDEVHFGEAGEGRAVAWVRFGESTDADGKRVLVIDEIQSKRHQEGREKGYRTAEAVAEEERLGDAVNEAQEAYDAYTRKMGEKYDGAYEDIYAEMTDAERAEADRLEQEVYVASEQLQNHDVSGIPDAPFEKNWHELAMKRMLRYAAENGYDKIAWTKGEQQAERYDLSKSFNYASYDKDEQKLLAGNIVDGVIDYNEPFIEENVPQEKLADYVGKENALRLIEEGRLIGDDLRIGGEGMKGFYDQMLPRFMDKYGKPWGVKTRDITLPNIGDKGLSMHSVDVTPQMKESVMEGQPMFFRTEDGQAYGFTLDGKIHIDPRIATAETPIHEYGHLWAQALRQANPEAWESLKGQLLGERDVMEYVTRRYPELEGDELMEEVFTHYGGKRGAERLRNDMREEMAKANGIFDKARVVTIFANLRRALREFWQAARDLFAGHNERLKEYSAKDFADMMMNDLLSGFNPTKVSKVDSVSGRDDGVLYRDNEDDIFFSNAQKAVEAIKQEKATPEQWLAMIQKNGGLKAGEDKWLGLSEWLKGSDAKTLTKQEVLDFILENQVQVEEVEYAEDVVPEEIQNEFDKYFEEESRHNHWSVAADRAWERLRDEYGDDLDIAFTLTGDNNTGFKVVVDNSEAAETLTNIPARVSNSTRLSYTTAGLENKREIALTVPTIESWNESDEVHFGDAGGGRAVAWVRFGDAWGYDEVDITHPLTGEKVKAKTDKKVLVIDEIQSKRHQEGREKGYVTKEDKTARQLYDDYIKARTAANDYETELQRKYNTENVTSDILTDEEQVYRRRLWEAAQQARDVDREYADSHPATRLAGGIPDAPFEKNWHELAMKRMLRYAAENGYDKVAWTKGEQQAERYGLGNKLDTVETYTINENDKKEKVVLLRGPETSIRLIVDYEGTIIQSNAKEYINEGTHLDTVVGKELALKIMQTGEDSATFKGEDLFVGGEGMKGFYDQMLPRFMDKYGKKWGVKTGEVVLPGLGDNGMTMWSVDVTPEMRESVMEGQPMFREGDPAPTPQRARERNSRERRQAHVVADETIRLLGLEGRVTVMDFPIGLTGRRAQAKGWYDTKTGKIVVVMNNHRSPEDVFKTILHEGVAHYGLRELFGKHFDDFLDNVYNGASTEIKESIAAKMEELQGRSNGANRSAEKLRRVATEEYLADLAESTDFENAENKPWVRHWFNQIKGWFLDMLGKLGLKGGFADGSVVLTDNELRYILWRSYKNLAEPGRYRNPFAVAEDVVMRRRMGVEVPVGLNQDSSDLGLDVAAEAKVVREGEPELEWHGERFGENWNNAEKLSVEEATARIDELSGKYHAAVPIAVTGKDGSDEELLSALFSKDELDRWVSTEDDGRNVALAIRKIFDKFGGSYVPFLKKIVIFADELPANLYEHAFFHENIHALFDQMDGNVREDILYNYWVDSPNEVAGVTKKEINTIYAEKELEERLEEFFVTTLARCMELGRVDMFETYIDDLSDKKTLDKLLNDLGYDKGRENSTRRRIYPSIEGRNSQDQGDQLQGSLQDIDEEGRINDSGYDKERESQKRMDLRNASNEASPIDTAREHPDARESRETESLESELLADDGSLFRDGEDGGFADTASYDRVMQQRFTRVREAWQDSMISVKTLQDTILKSRGEYEDWDNDKNSFEDAYNAENRMHGISRNEDEWYVRNLYTPLRNAFSDFMRYFDIDEAEAVRYMVSKTGLERNQFYAMSNAAEQKATEIVEKKKSEVEEAYAAGQLNVKDYRRKMRELDDSIRDEARKIIAQFKEDPQAVALRSRYHGGLITYADLLAELEQIRRKYVMRAQPLTDDAGNVVSDNYYDGNVRDYSGLTELHDKAGYDKLMQLRKMAIDEKDIEKSIKMWKEAEKMQKELFFSVTEKAVAAVDTIEIDAAQKKLLDDKVIVPIVYQRGTKKRREQVHRLWDAVNASNAWTLKKSYESGLISKENYQYISGMFDFYMPLRGWNDTEAREQYDYLESTGTAYSPSVVKTYGRLSAADHPLAYMRSMATSAIVGGNKNLMKQHFLRFAMNHPSNLVTFGKMWYERIGTNAGGESIWEPRYPDIPENATADEAANIVAAFNEEMRLKEAEGNATQHKGSLRVKYPIRKSEATEHHVEVVRNGETYVIYINGDPRAAQALNGSRRRMAQMKAGESSRIANAVRWMAANYTSKSPSFTMANLARDITMATTVAAIKEGRGYTALLTANLFRLLIINPTRRGGAMMPSLMYKYQHGTLDMDKPTERYFYEFMTYGGETGFTALQDIDDIKELMEKEFQKDNREKLDPRRVLSALGDGMEWVNRCIEDATRFATYMASRESGRGVNRSVNDAKNITLNFNRKGTGENLDGIKFLKWLPSNATARNLYAFVNPAVQAMHTLAHLVKHHKRIFTLVTSTWVAAGVLTPLLNEFLINAFGDDDDKEKYWSLPKWVRRNNFCLYIPGVKRFIQIPLAQEFRVFYGLGEIATTTYLGHDTIRAGALDIVESSLDLLPLDFTGSGGNPVASLAPTVVKPVTDIAVNTSFTGYPIWKETPWNKNEPAFQKAYSRTPSYMIGMSEDINDWTGGNEHLRGWLERTKVGQYANNPAVWQHLAEGYFGGMYSFLSQGGGTLWTLIHGSRPSDMQIPVWNRFVNNPDDRVQSGRLRLGDAYYKLKGEADDIKSMFSAFKKDTKSQDEAVRLRGEKMMAMKHELDKKLKFEQDGMAYEPSVWIDPEIERLYRRSFIFKEYDSEIDKHKGMIERHLDEPKVVLTAEQNIKEAVAEMVSVASSSERPSVESPDGSRLREERLRRLRTGKKWAQYYDEIATYEDTQADQLLARKKKDAKERGDNVSLARIKPFEKSIRENGKKLLGYGHDEERMENIRLWRSRAIEILEEGEKKENGD